jgi:hypothetical protein
VRLLVKNVGTRVPEAEFRDPEKDRSLTPHSIVTVARCPDVA